MGVRERYYQRKREELMNNLAAENKGDTSSVTRSESKDNTTLGVRERYNRRMHAKPTVSRMSVLDTRNLPSQEDLDTYNRQKRLSTELPTYDSTKSYVQNLFEKYRNEPTNLANYDAKKAMRIETGKLKEHADNVMTSDEYANRSKNYQNRADTLNSSLPKWYNWGQDDSNRKKEADKLTELADQDKYKGYSLAPDYAEKSAYASSVNTDGFFKGETPTMDLKYEKINKKLETDSKDDKLYNDMTDDEIGMYNYIHTTKGKKEADKYLDYIKSDLYDRDNTEEAEEAYDYSEEHPVLGSAKSVIDNLGSASDSAAYLLYGKWKDNPVNQYTRGSAISSAERQAVMDEVNGPEILGKDVFDVTYSAGMGLADSTTMYAFTGGNSKAVLPFLSANNSTMYDVKKRGGTDEEAFITGIASGIFEGLFESVSIGQFESLKEVSPHSIKDVAKNIAKSMGVNASEEALTEAANITFDTIANGDISQIEYSTKQYIESGMSKKDARKQAILDAVSQVAEAGVAGGIMGVGVGAAGSTIGYINNRSANKNVQNNTNNAQDDNNNVRNNAFTGTIESQQNDLILALNQAKTRDELDSIYEKASDNEALKDVADLYHSMNAVKFNSSNNTETETNFETGTVRANQEQNQEQKQDTVQKVLNRGNINDSQAKNIVRNFSERFESITGEKITGATEQEKIDNVISISNNYAAQMQQEVENDNIQIPEQRKMEVQSEIINLASTYDKETAQSFVNGYNSNMSPEQYKIAYNKLYTAGLIGTQADTALFQNQIYVDMLGHDASIEAVQNGIRVAGEISSKAVSTDQIKLATDFAKVINARVQIVDDIAGANGMYKDGTIYISKKSLNPSMVVLSHELTHSIRDSAPDAYQNYEDFVLDYFKTEHEAEYNTIFDRLSKQYGTEDASSINEEIVANAAETFLTDADAVERFVKKDRTAAQKVLDFLKGFIEKLKKLYKGYKAGSREGKMLASDIEKLEQARDLWFEALDSKTESSRHSKSVTKHMLYNTFEQRYDEWDKKSTGGYFKIGRTSEVLKGIGISDQVIQWDKSKIRTIKKEHTEMTDEIIKQVPDLLEHPIIVMDSLTVLNRIVLFGNLFDKNNNPIMVALELAPMQKKQGIYEIRNVIKISSAYKRKNLQYLINNSNILYVNPNKKVTNEWLGFLRLQLPVELTHYGYISKVTYYDVDVNGNKILSHSDDKTDMQKAMEDAGIKFSLKDSEGNKLTEQQQEFFKDSKVRDSEGNLKVMYHGTQSSGFTVFDRKKAKSSGFHGTGLYFTDGKSHAGQYGENGVYEVYLNIKNPIQSKPGMESYNITAEHIRVFLDAVAEDEDYGIENYGYGATVDSIAESLEEKDDYGIIADINATCIGDFVKAVELFNLVNETEYDGVITPLETVAFHSEQVKNIDNTNPTDSEDIRYSLKDIPDSEDSWLDEILDARDKDATVDILESGFKALKNQKVDTSDVSKIARRLKSEYHSNYDYQTFADNLEKVFAHIQSSDRVSYEDMISIMSQVTKPVIDESTRVDKDMANAYKSFQSTLKSTKISLDDTQKAELDKYYDSTKSGSAYEQYRRSVFGKINLTDKGTNIDSVWSDLVEASQGWLDYETNSNDMIFALEDALAGMKPNAYNVYGMDNEKAAYDMALRVYEEYFKSKSGTEIANAKNLLNKHAKEWRERQKATYDERLRNLRIADKQKISRLKEEMDTNQRWKDAEQKQKDKEYRDKMLFKMEQLKASHRESVKLKSRITKNQAEARKYKKRIVKNSKDMIAWLNHPTDKKHVPEVLRKSTLQMLSSIDFVSDRAKADSANTLRWRERMLELQTKLTKLEHDDRGEGNDILMALDPDFLPRMDDFLEKNKKANISQLNTESLKELDYIISTLKHCITNVNKMYANKMYEHIQDVGNETLGYLSGKKDKKNYVPDGVEKMFHVDRLVNMDMVDSFTYFESLGKGAYSVFQEIRDGFDKRVFCIYNAMKYMNGVLKGIDTKSWSGNEAEVHEVGKMKITTGQIMSLYLLNKRKQAKLHIESGGIRIGSIHEKASKTEVYHLSKNQLENLFNKLSPEQIRVAEAMQKYMANECSKWGNEVSMQMYGYDKFTEKDYFPIKTDPNTNKTNDNNEKKTNQVSLYGIRNQGMTKATVEGAKNPVIIDDIITVFNEHVLNMANYNAYAIPLTDAMKWYNYKVVESEGKIDFTHTVKAEIERTYGSEAKSYFIDFILKINGDAAKESSADIGNNLAGKYKAAAVGLNLRVAIQQPMAYVRAMNMIKTKYLLAGLAKPASTEKAIKYSAIAKWKSWGFYDTGIGKSMRELITGQTRTVDKVREASMALAQMGDNLTFGKLWNAVEAEISDKYKDVVYDSAEYNNLVTQRFSDIIDRTQVVDTVLHRSQFMRSKDGLAKMEASFMAEPTKTYNMLLSAFRSRDKKKIYRAIITYIFANLLTSAASSIPDAFRDDDDGTWLEKYLEAFKANAIDNLNPINMIPYLRHISSFVDGYSADRMDLAPIGNTINAFRKIFESIWGDSNQTPYTLTKSLAKGLSQITGISVYNAWRELESMYNFFADDNLGQILTDNQKVIRAIEKGEGVDEAIDKATDGNTNTSGTRKSITSYYKPKYISGTSSEQAEIRRKLYDTGLYGSTDDVVKECRKWLNDATE